MKYCEKHKQKYMDHVKRCPICVGEEMSKNNKEKKEERLDIYDLCIIFS